jgi:hypothetical protein
VNLKVNRAGVKNPEARRICLPSEGFKGILADPMGATAAFAARGWIGEASVQGAILVQGAVLHFLCRDKSHPIEPNSLSLRQTLRADR